MDTDDSSEASDDDSLNNNSGNSGSGSAGNSLSKNVKNNTNLVWITTYSEKITEKFRGGWVCKEFWSELLWEIWQSIKFREKVVNMKLILYIIIIWNYPKM